MPPAYVKPYVKRGKTEAADAEAVCEAVVRPTRRFVPVKSPEQQAALINLSLATREPSTEDIRLAFPKLAHEAGASRHLRLATLHCLAHLKSLKLRMIQIQRLVVSCPPMRCPERL
jgi:hypothetical protein